jgi:Tetratricopeptide repeat
VVPEMHLENVQNAIVDSTITTEGGDVLVNGQKITNYFYSAQYQDLKKQLDKLQERFDKTRQKIEKYGEEDFIVEFLQIDEERQEVQTKLDDLKQEVIRLAETFIKIPINTERLRLARRHFEAGDYPAARAILDAEQMGSELEALLQQKEHIQRQHIENEDQLIDKANEFLILARLTAIDFTLSNRFRQTIGYFEQSLKAAHTVDNTFAYAYFLQKDNQFKAASVWYEEALALYRTLAEAHPEAYLPDVAMTLNNLGSLQRDQHDFAAAAASYQEALAIRRTLAEAHPEAYLPNVAMTLNNLGLLQSDQHDFAAAASYQEALALYRTLAEAHPEAYLPNVIMTEVNLSIFYLQTVPDKEKSLTYAKEAMVSALPLVEFLPVAKDYARSALQVAETWGLDAEEFLNEAIRKLDISIRSV